MFGHTKYVYFAMSSARGSVSFLFADAVAENMTDSYIILVAIYQFMYIRRPVYVNQNMKHTHCPLWALFGVLFHLELL